MLYTVGRCGKLTDKYDHTSYSYIALLGAHIGLQDSYSRRLYYHIAVFVYYCQSRQNLANRTIQAIQAIQQSRQSKKQKSDELWKYGNATKMCLQVTQTHKVPRPNKIASSLKKTNNMYICIITNHRYIYKYIYSFVIIHIIVSIHLF